MNLVRKALIDGESNSMLILARSKQTLHALIQQIEVNIQREIYDKNRDANLRVIKVNSTLNNSEPKI